MISGRARGPAKHRAAGVFPERILEPIPLLFALFHSLDQHWPPLPLVDTLQISPYYILGYVRTSIPGSSLWHFTAIHLHIFSPSLPPPSPPLLQHRSTYKILRKYPTISLQRETAVALLFEALLLLFDAAANIVVDRQPCQPETSTRCRFRSSRLPSPPTSREGRTRGTTLQTQLRRQRHVQAQISFHTPPKPP